MRVNITAFYPGVFRRGRGGTRGYRNFYYATGLPGYADNPFPQQDIDPKQETKFLKSQSEFLSQQLSNIQERLSQLEKQKEDKKQLQSNNNMTYSPDRLAIKYLNLL